MIYKSVQNIIQSPFSNSLSTVLAPPPAGGGAGPPGFGSLIYYNEWYNASTVLLSSSAPTVNTIGVGTFNPNSLSCGPEGYAYYNSGATAQTLFSHNAFSGDEGYECEFWNSDISKTIYLYFRSNSYTSPSWQVRTYANLVSIVEDNATTRASISIATPVSTTYNIKVTMSGDVATVWQDDVETISYTCPVKGNKSGLNLKPNSGATRCHWSKIYYMA